MFKTQLTTKPDLIGASASTLCAIHCLAAPLLFLAHAGLHAGHVEVPSWYQMIDYFFLVISFIAIFYSVKKTSKTWMIPALWITWSLLLLAIVNETFEIQHVGEAAVYIPAVGLAGLHLYNRKYCQCEEECCTQVA